MNKGQLSYIIRLNQAYEDSEHFIPIRDWYRDFEVSGSYTLENLSSIILDILDWDSCHLYEFKIRDIHYAWLGFEDSIIIIDWPGKYISCDIPIQALELNEKETFTYLYDFGDENRFVLSILEIRQIFEERKQPTLISYEGKNLVQYPFEMSSDFEEKEIVVESPSIDVFHELNKKERWHVRFLHSRDKEVLEEWRKSNNKKKWQKAVTILENWALSLDQISSKVEKRVRIIKKWIEAFNRYGLEGLEKARKKRDESKRHKKIEEKRRRILEILHQKPNIFGINRSNWSSDSLSSAYEKAYNEPISSDYVRKLIKSAGYTLKKARKVLTSPDQDYREKVELLLNTLQSLKSDEMFFFIDELGPLRVKRYGGRTYIKKDSEQTIPLSQKVKGSIILAGALNATTNQVTWHYGKSKDTSSMIDLIEILFNQYYDKSKLYITWDAASWHNSNTLIDWLDEFNSQTRKIKMGPIIELVPLPSNSQFLDVIESVFSGMKRAVIHHSDYQSKKEMKVAISRHFQERNEYFKENPKRAGKKIWEIDFFSDQNNIKSGTYREW